MAVTERARCLGVAAVVLFAALPVQADAWLRAALMRRSADGAIELATVGARGIVTWAIAGTALRRVDRIDFARPAAGAAVADFDRDGADEVALAGGSGVILLEPGDAAGAGPVEAAAGRLVLRVADVDADGWPDVVALHDGGLHWWRNVDDPLLAGRRTLLPDALPDATWRQHAVRDLLAADLDGDGRQELVLARGAAGVLVLVNAPDGLRAAPFPGLAAVPAGRVAVADLDGDGRSDLAVAGRDVDGDGLVVTAAMNRGARGLEVAARVRLPAGGPPWIGPIDWDLDGVEDLAVATGPGRARVLSWGSAEWRPLVSLELPGPPRAVVDTGDGRAAIVAGGARDGAPRLVAPAPRPGAHWLGVVLEGYRHRPVADAGIVLVRRDGRRLARRAGARRVAVQLGAFGQWDMLAVYWPGGRVVRHEVRGLERYVTVTEPDPAVRPAGDRAVGRPQRWRPMLECGVAG